MIDDNCALRFEHVLMAQKAAWPKDVILFSFICWNSYIRHTSRWLLLLPGWGLETGSYGTPAHIVTVGRPVPWCHSWNMPAWVREQASGCWSLPFLLTYFWMEAIVCFLFIFGWYGIFIFAFDFLLGRRGTHAPFVITDNVGKQPKSLEKMTKDVIYYFVYNAKDLLCCY